MKKYTEIEIEKEIEDYLTEIFRTRKVVPERKVMIYRACDYNGHIKGYDHCGNEDCRACNNHIKQFNNYVKEWIVDNPIEVSTDEFLKDSKTVN